MERWVWFAILSMFFAGFTSVIAKQGLAGITGELGLTVRTVFVSVFVFLFASVAVARTEWSALTSRHFLWLGASGLTTAISWIFYYKALKEGEVSTVALIDKGSFIVAVALAWWFLGEAITPRKAVGAALILAGLLVVSRK